MKVTEDAESREGKQKKSEADEMGRGREEKRMEKQEECKRERGKLREK